MALPWFCWPTDNEIAAASPVLWVPCPKPNKKKERYIRFRDEDNKTNYVHTLNGSGLATPRVLAALIETHQKEDGSISIPSSLQPYTGLAEIK